MTIQEALEILINHQKWRQGLTNDMPYTPHQLTAALDMVIAELSPKTAVHKPPAIGQIEEVARQYFEVKYPLMDLTNDEDKCEIDWWDMLQFVQHVLSCHCR